MNPMLEKLKKLGKDKKMPEYEKEGKMSAIKSLGDLANEGMSDKIKGLKKVTVASNSPKGLEEGLSKAKEMVSGHEGEMDDEMSPEHEAMETPEMEMAEHEPCDESSSPEEIDAEILRLMQLKKSKEA